MYLYCIFFSEYVFFCGGEHVIGVSLGRFSFLLKVLFQLGFEPD